MANLTAAALIIRGMPPISLTGCLFDDRALKTKNEDFAEEWQWERQCEEQGEVYRSAEAFVVGDWKYENTCTVPTAKRAVVNSLYATRRCL